MKVCIRCGGEFKNRNGQYCSTECSGSPSKNKRHGLCETPEYNSWTSMRERCNNKNRPAYQGYGARGITYCARWDVFENFLADMGPRPSQDYTLERIDNDGNYGPDNCKWASKKEQSNNRSGLWSDAERLIAADGVSAGLDNREIGALVGKSKSAVASFIFKQGWRRSPEQISDIHRRAQMPRFACLHDK